MTTRSLSFAGIGITLLTLACGREMPLGPSQLNNERAAVAEAPMSSSSISAPTLTTASTSEVVVTLQPDLTVSPAVVGVAAGRTILMVNNSSRYVLLRSYNCSQFSSMQLESGASKHTMPFTMPGKTCEYFVWDYPQKIFQGKVSVY